MKYANNKNGILIVNKPIGLTSRDVVNKVQRVLNTKAGHTGTLDPLATGVLVITLGKATKLSEILTSETKEYEASVILGFETDTLDIEGKVLKKKNNIITEKQVIKAINHFKGSYLQEVPKYSAVKINGKKLYEYAREGIDVNLPKRKVTIYDIKLLDFKSDNQIEFKFYVKVSKGTYIRSLIRDIAHYLNTYGSMSALTRISQGKFNITDACDIDKITCDKIIPIQEALNIPIKEVDDNYKFKILNGSVLNGKDKEILFVSKEGEELAIYHNIDGKLRMWKMLYETSRKNK